jgi:hypothetical protein
MKWGSPYIYGDPRKGLSSHLPLQALPGTGLPFILCPMCDNQGQSVPQGPPSLGFLNLLTLGSPTLDPVGQEKAFRREEAFMLSTFRGGSTDSQCPHCPSRTCS